MRKGLDPFLQNGNTMHRKLKLSTMRKFFCAIVAVLIAATAPAATYFPSRTDFRDEQIYSVEQHTVLGQSGQEHRRPRLAR